MWFRHVIYIIPIAHLRLLSIGYLHLQHGLSSNQPEPLMKLPISVEQDSMQFHTSVLIDSTTTLNFASQDFLTRNNFLGRCILGRKIVVRIASKQRISTSKTFSPAYVSVGLKIVQWSKLYYFTTS